MKPISERVFEYRGRHELSQKKFAKLAGLAEMTINKAETKDYKLQAITQAKIEKVLAMEHDEKLKENLIA